MADLSVSIQTMLDTDPAQIEAMLNKVREQVSKEFVTVNMDFRVDGQEIQKKVSCVMNSLKSQINDTPLTVGPTVDSEKYGQLISRFKSIALDGDKVTDTFSKMEQTARGLSNTTSKVNAETGELKSTLEDYDKPAKQAQKFSDSIKKSIQDIYGEINKLQDPKAFVDFTNRIKSIDTSTISENTVRSLDELYNTIKNFSGNVKDIDNLTTNFSKLQAQITGFEKAKVPVKEIADNITNLKGSFEAIRDSDIGEPGKAEAFKKLGASVKEVTDQLRDYQKYSDTMQRTQWYIDRLGKNTPLDVRTALSAEAINIPFDISGNWKQSFSEIQKQIANLRASWNTFGDSAKQMDDLDIAIKKAGTSLSQLKVDSGTKAPLSNMLEGYKKQAQDLRIVQEDLKSQITAVEEQINSWASMGASPNLVKPFEIQLLSLKEKFIETMQPVDDLAFNIRNLKDAMATARQDAALENQIRTTSNAIETMLRKFSDTDAMFAFQKKFYALATDTSKDVGTIKTELDSLKAKIKSSFDLSEEGRKLSAAINQIENAFQTFRIPTAQLNEFRAKYEAIMNSDMKVPAATRAINDLIKSMNAANQSGGFLLNQLRMLTYQYLSIYQVIRLFRKAFDGMKEIDSQMSELAKVSSVTRDQFQQTAIAATEMASRWGKSASDFLAAETAFARTGVQNYQQLAEISVMAQAAGDMTADLANQYLIASNAAFQLGSDTIKLTALLDGQNQVNKIACVCSNVHR